MIEKHFDSKEVAVVEMFLTQMYLSQAYWILCGIYADSSLSMPLA